MSETLTAIYVVPDSVLPGARPVAGTQLSWLDANGNPINAVVAASTVRDPVSGAGASVTAPGGTPTGVITVQGNPSGTPLPISGSFAETPWNKTVVTAINDTVVSTNPCTLYAIVPLDPSAPQDYEIKLFDSASGGGSGTLVFDQIGLSSKTDIAGTPGLKMSAGICANLQNAPTGGGVMVLWR